MNNFKSLSTISEYVNNIQYFINNIKDINTVINDIYTLTKISSPIKWFLEYDKIRKKDLFYFVVEDYFKQFRKSIPLLKYLITIGNKDISNEIFKLIHNIYDIVEFNTNMNGKYFGFECLNNLEIDLFDISFINYICELNITEEIICSYAICSNNNLQLKHILLETMEIEMHYYNNVNGIIIYIDGYRKKSIGDITTYLREFKLMKMNDDISF